MCRNILHLLLFSNKNLLWHSVTLPPWFSDLSYMFYSTSSPRIYRYCHQYQLPVISINETARSGGKIRYSVEKKIPAEFWLFRNSVFNEFPHNFTEFRNLTPAELRNSIKFRRHPVVRNSAGHTSCDAVSFIYWRNKGSCRNQPPQSFLFCILC